MKSLLISLICVISLWADAHIFVYHRFGDNRHPSTDTTISELKKEFRYFKENGYKVVPLEQLTNALKSGKDIPDSWIVLTIDDNFKSFYDNALEVFKEYGYPFSLFVYVEATEKKYPDYLTWKQLREIQKYGSLEFHSYTHPHMTHLSNHRLEADFKKGLDIFEKRLGFKPKYFTYPYGEYDDRVKAITKSFGFEAIVNQNMGAVGKNSDIYDLDRNALVGKTNLKFLLKFKHLDATWLEPKLYPKDGTLKALHVETKESAKHAGLYISGNGWQKIAIKNGIIDLKLDKKLTKERNRVIISIQNKISTKLLVKD